MKPNNFIGKRFGMLTVVSRAPNNSSGKTMWNCICDCGREKRLPVSSYDLESGKVRSCGCLYAKSNSNGRSRTHGQSKTRLYHVWSGMKRRCNSPTANEYENYGGRGIKLCPEWESSFLSFMEWAVLNGYDDSAGRGECTIDRIDVNQGYSPENCRFISIGAQAENRRNTVRIAIGGASKTAKEWSEISGIRSATILWRYKNGWEESEILIPVNLNNRNIRRNKNA